PGGTLNHFARDLGVSTEAAEALELALGGTCRGVDIGIVNGRAFLTTSSVGAYVRFVRIRERLERRFGYRFASTLAAFRILLQLRSFAVELEVDGKPRIYRTPLVFIGVGEREMQLPTLGSRVSDGKRGLHVMVVRGRSRARLLARALAAIVGERRVLERPGELRAYESDGLPGYQHRPSLAVFPGSREETVAVVKLFAERGVRFVPRGAGTGLSGGALADDVVLLGLHRLTRIIHVDADNAFAVVEPGVVNVALSRAVSAHGLHYAPDPSSQAACTIGGNVAENAGGPHCLKYGVTLNHVAALTVVLPNGDVVQLGNAAGESEGYDLVGTFVGSEGCFGIGLDVTVRLARIP